MNRALLSLATLGAVVTLAAVFAAGAPRARAADIFVLFLGALVMTGLLGWAWRVSGAGRPSRYERALRQPPPRESTQPPALARTERIVALAADNARKQSNPTLTTTKLGYPSTRPAPER